MIKQDTKKLHFNHVVSRFRVKSCAGLRKVFYYLARKNKVPHENLCNGALFHARKWTVARETFISSHEILQSLREVFLRPAQRNTVSRKDSCIQTLSRANRKESRAGILNPRAKINFLARRLQNLHGTVRNLYGQRAKISLKKCKRG